MAKDAQRRKSQRRPVEQKEVYRYTDGLQTPARVVDTYVRPGKQSKGLDGLITALEGSGKLLQGYGQIKAQQNKEDKQSGYLKGMAGEQPEENANDAKIAGFERAAGEGTTLDFKTQVEGYLRDNWDTDPETFQEGLNSMLPEYTEEKSEAFLEGFVPKANRSIEQAQQQYFRLQNNKMKQDGLTSIGKGFTGDLEIIFEEVEPDKQPQAIRDAVSRHQKSNKSYMTRMEISEHLVDIMGQRAVEEANPDLLDFTEEPDKQGGTKLTDTALVNKIKAYQRNALNAYDQEQRGEQARRQQAHKERKAQVERDLVVTIDGMSSLVDPVELRAAKADMINQFSEPGENGIALDANDLQTYMDGWNSLIEAEGFNDVDKSSSEVEVVNAIDSMGKADDFEKALKVLTSNKYNLTKGTYVSMYKKLINERKLFENQDTQEYKNNYSSSRASFFKTLNQLDPQSASMFGGGFSDTLKSEIVRTDNKRRSMVVLYMNDLQNDLKKKGEYPPSNKDVYAMYEDARKWAFEQVPLVDTSDAEETFGSGSNNNNNQDNKPSGTSPKSEDKGKGRSREDRLNAL